jgi:hypothetical protein
METSLCGVNLHSGRRRRVVLKLDIGDLEDSTVLLSTEDRVHGKTDACLMQE